MDFDRYKDATLKGTAYFNEKGELIDFKPASFGVPKPQPQPKPKPEDYYELSAKSLIRNLKSILKDNKALRFTGNFTRGKLIDTRKLIRVTTGNYKIFKKQLKEALKNYNVVIAVDVSGSMRDDVVGMVSEEDREKINALHEAFDDLEDAYDDGDIGGDEYDDEYSKLDKEMRRIKRASTTTRIKMAGIVSLNLIQALEEIGINFAVIDFNHTIEVKKDFGKPLKEDYIQNLIDRAYSGDGRCNHDNEAIDKALQMLKDKEGHNIIITFSDGEPVLCTANSDRTLKTSITRASQTTDVIGIGIESKSVRRYYKNSEVISTPQQFEQAIVKQLKRAVKNAKI